MRFVLDLSQPPRQCAEKMSSPHPQERDPLQEDHPWEHTVPTAPTDASAAAGQTFRDDTDAAADASRPTRGSSRAFATGARELPPIRVIHDNPPTWSGDSPDKELEPYLKMLRGWLLTTRTLKAQQGMTIFNHATGDLQIIINEIAS